MGNCWPNEGFSQKSARRMFSLRGLSHTDRRNGRALDDRLQAYMYQGPMPFTGHTPLGYPGYRLQGTQGLLIDPSRGFLPPRDSLLLLDPYTGLTYECDEAAYKRIQEKGRRYQRRAERGKPSTHHHQHDDDDDDKAGEEDDEKRRHHNHQPSNNNQTTATTNRQRATGVKRLLNASGEVKTTPRKSAVARKSQKTSAHPGNSTLMAPGLEQGSEAPLFETTFVLKYEAACYQPPDVVISSCCCRSDQQVMQTIKDKVEGAGMTVWVGSSSCWFAGSQRTVTTAEAIIDTKLFVCIVSEPAVKSSCWEDEMALASISDTVIFPVSLQTRQQLLPLMSTALKLELSDPDWMWLRTPDSLSANLDTLVSVLRAELADLSLSMPVPQHDHTVSVTVPVTSLTGLSQQTKTKEPGSNWLSPRYSKRHVTSVRVGSSDIVPDQFWTKHFGPSNYVIPWDQFSGALLKDFGGQLDRLVSAADQRHLLDMVKRRMEVDPDGQVYKSQFLALCSSGGQPGPVWRQVQDVARRYFAVSQVFRGQSSVSKQAMHHLDKMSSASVMAAVRDVLADRDIPPSVRSVGTLALARGDVSDPETLRHALRMLRDSDGGVRGAAYLAVSHVRFRQAVSQLSHVWSVRQKDVTSGAGQAGEAAAAALSQLCLQEVEDARSVLRLLEKQLRALRSEPEASPL